MIISAIIPVYNAARYVAEAIDSVLAQTRPAAEIIVVDDGSTDGSGDVVARYGDAVRTIVQPHSGASVALNRGLREARGDVIAFLDADDFWAGDKLEREAAVLDADPVIDGVFGYVRQFVDRDAAAGAAVALEPQPGISRYSLLVRRHAFDRYGYFDEALRTADFVPWYTRAVALGFRTVTIPHVVAYRRLHGANIGIVRREEQAQENLLGLKRALDVRRSRGDPAKPRC